ncbi:hypothetical protein BG004_002315 [Podila humilis]|nr:hypothetical protein BG004_002315 [Podila humilis]
MISSDTTSSITINTFQHHRKRSSTSAFSTHRRTNSELNLNSSNDSNTYINSSNNNSNDGDTIHMKPLYTTREVPPGLCIVPTLKKKYARRALLRRPWTNAEQESLYVAVEHLKLFGRWGEVKIQMNLDRTTLEIEEEYMRLYGELPDTDDDWMQEDDNIEEDEEDEEGMEEEEDYEEEDRELEDVSSQSTTPPLTASSSCAPSARSSQESFSILYSGAAAAGTTGTVAAAASQKEQQPRRQMSRTKHNRASSSIDISAFHIRDRLPSLPDKDEPQEMDVVGAIRYITHHDSNHTMDINNGGHHSPHSHSHSQHPYHSHTSPTSRTHTKSASSISISTDTARPAAAASSVPSTSTTSASSSSRMVRVWTIEQSENLKNLIEVYFPGSYRINWVWVAAQMGNAFTRKQCKNKWEIMRRRMGSDEEIALLKKGYSEFGASWGQIQEKYLPERSRGGISIMWELLEARELEAKTATSSSSSLPLLSTTTATTAMATTTATSALTAAGPSINNGPSSHVQTGSSSVSVSSGHQNSRGSMVSGALLSTKKTPECAPRRQRTTTTATNSGEVAESVVYQGQGTTEPAEPYYPNETYALGQAVAAAQQSYRHHSHPSQQHQHPYQHLQQRHRAHAAWSVGDQQWRDEISQPQTQEDVQYRHHHHQHHSRAKSTGKTAQMYPSQESFSTRVRADHDQGPPPAPQQPCWTEHEVQHLPMVPGFQASPGVTIQQQQQHQQHQQHQQQQEHYATLGEHFVGHPRDDMRMDVEQ